MTTKRFRLKSQPLEQDIQALTLRVLGQEQWTVRDDGQWKPTGIFRSADGSMFWRANAGSQVVEDKGRKRLFKANPAGTSDILGIVRGLLVCIELKRPGARQRPAQLWWQQLVELAGAAYRVCESPNEARAFVDEIRRAS